jgi:hypothetical protein
MLAATRRIGFQNCCQPRRHPGGARCHFLGLRHHHWFRRLRYLQPYPAAARGSSRVDAVKSISPEAVEQPREWSSW